MSATAVDVKNVTHRYEAFTALADVSLTVPTGSYTVFLGPSGSGKTTLLSVIGGFLVPQEGSVLINGQDMTAVPPAKRPTTTVFQDYALFPHMTIGANVAFGLRMRGIGSTERMRRAHDMLDLVGLKGSEAKRPHELSGGQRQRVALARALAVEPSVLLLDEPLGALDLKLRRQMQAELKAIQREVGTSFIHVTHDQEEAMAIGDTIVVMSHGRIEDMGTPERVYLKPATLFAAGFMGQSSFLKGKVRWRTGGRLDIETPLGRLPLTANGSGVDAGDNVVLSIRPEHFVVGTVEGPALSLGSAMVEDMTFAGAHHLAVMRHETLDSFRPMVQMPQIGETKPGATVALGVLPEDVVILKDEA
ncbi:ABC transporter ATP-binding protein [Rhodobium gokarnense]|uniref:Spermidine/putrescine transport system ATP-binding protein n=1 Tax=Rhodobium gokarnense TaxID=364296 RepID=A0ABT3HDE0_9HYPH|nr:ABC transporter ATP-binding protein [Rhodobium gokarnense]MCW2308424.1 spermidine/putrescine transport system ATP-binding protein [Rhodobium gokarnense]